MINWFLRITCLLIIGAVINIAVAWGWAAWGVPPHTTLGQWSISNEGSPFWIVQGHGGAGAAVWRAGPYFQSDRVASSYQALGRRRSDVPARVVARFQKPPTAQDRSWRYGFDERGWPLRCLRSEHRYEALDSAWTASEMIGEVTVTGGIALWPEQTRRGGWALQRVRALPLQPIWPGFVANTLLYAAVVALCFFGYPAMARVLGARRSLKRAVIAIVVSPLFVIAVTWMTALSNDSNAMPMVNSGDRRANGQAAGKHLAMTRQDRWGATRLVFFLSTNVTREPDQLPSPPIDGALPGWARSTRSEVASREWRHFEWFTAEALGWPARALGSTFASKVTESLTTVVTIEHGIQIDKTPAGFDVGVANDLRLLPTQVIWSGFLLNWIFYAFVLFGLMALPGAVKRTHRLRRGRCPDCGYDLRGAFNAGCPECGWRRAPNSGMLPRAEPLNADLAGHSRIP